MMNDMEKAWFFRVLPDAIAFVIGLGVAYFLGWETKDLVWSLWLCSLVLGYLTLLSAIGAGAYIGLWVSRQKDWRELPKRQRLLAFLIGSAVGLFVLGFFSLHFCGFHAGHSVFLASFFPIPGMPKDGFGQAFMNPPLLWVLVFRYLMKPYGLFLIAAIIAERRYVFLPLITAVQGVHEETAKGLSPTPMATRPGKDSHPLGDAMVRPYINVVRMHLLIFFFAFCHALKVDSFLVYAVVYSVYFLPWRELMRLKRRAADQPDAADA